MHIWHLFPISPLANNNNNKFNSQVLQQHIFRKKKKKEGDGGEPVRERERLRGRETSARLFSSHQLQAKLAVIWTKLTKGWLPQRRMLAQGFCFWFSSLVALGMEEKISSFSKFPTIQSILFSWYKEEQFVHWFFVFLSTSTPIPFPWQPSHLWSNEYESKKET